MQQRMQQADQMLTRDLSGRGYNPQQVQELLRLAHQMSQGRQVTLGPTGVQSTLNPSDLTQANLFLRAVRALPAVPVSDVHMGITRNRETGRMEDIALNVRTMDSRGRPHTEPYRPPHFIGPGIGPVVRQEVAPAPVRTFVYNVTVDNTTYQVEMNTALRAGGATTFENSRLAQLRGIMSDHPDQILAVTVDGRRVDQQRFVQAYSAAYIAMLRQSLDGQQPDERINIETVRRRPSG